MSLFPWDDKNKTPYFINDDGFEWWIDESTTDWCNNERLDKTIMPLKAVCFIIRKDATPLSYIVVDRDQNVLAENTSLEAIASKIDILRIAKGD